ncbi:MAG: hypothetical protein FWG50_06550 [Kiritimatiellaeota bacterium]|nr:hypothetical protein [Kiritimatiellota bacterium]
MKIHILLLCSCVFLFYGCATEMGVQQIKNQHIPTISMVQVYDVMEREFPDYRIKLIPVPESSKFMIAPEWERVYIEPHHNVVMRSKENNIIIMYHIESSKKKRPFVGIDIWYFLKGENCHDRLSELSEPMAKVKKCLTDNFPEKITEEDFTEEFRPIFHQIRGWQIDDY